MAEKLSVTIALEGGREIQQQLKDIGEAGQKAFLDIAKAAQQVGGFDKLKIDDVTKQLINLGITGTKQLNAIGAALDSAIRTEKAVAAVRTLETGITVLSGGVTGLLRIMGPLGLAITAASLALEKFSAIAVDAVDAINGIAAAAAKIGASIENYDKLSQALQKSGISADAAKEGIQKISEAMDKGKIDAVAAAFDNLQKSGRLWNQTASGMRFPSTDLRTLQDAAAGVGPAAEKAREALKKLGQPIPTGNIFAPPIPQVLADVTAGAQNAQQGMAAFIAMLERIPDQAERNATAFRLMGAAGLAIAQDINTGKLSSEQFAAQVAKDANTITQAMANTAASVQQNMNEAKNAFARFMTTGDTAALGEALSAFHRAMMTATDNTTARLGNLISKIGELASSLASVSWGSISGAGAAAWNAVASAVQSAATAISSFVSSIGSITWNAIADAAVSAWNAITDAIMAAIKMAMKFFGLNVGGAGTGTASQPGAKASGGLIGGRGTGTSDSNLVWLSRGEFVISAAAVRHFGTNFFAALNALRHPPGFALGGPVGMPALAGGLGGGGNLGTLTLGLPSGDSVTVRASVSAVDQLRREAAMAQVRSGGRKPSRYT